MGAAASDFLLALIPPTRQKFISFEQRIAFGRSPFRLKDNAVTWFRRYCCRGYHQIRPVVSPAAARKAGTASPTVGDHGAWLIRAERAMVMALKAWRVMAAANYTQPRAMVRLSRHRARLHAAPVYPFSVAAGY